MISSVKRLMIMSYKKKAKTLEKNSFFVVILKATTKKSRIRIRNQVYESKDPDVIRGKFCSSNA